MRNPVLAVLLLLAACAQPLPPPPASTTARPGAAPPAFPPGLTPAQQSQIELRRAMRAEDMDDRVNAADPTRPMQTGEPEAIRSGDIQLPDIPNQPARVFRSF